jgi:hypothetical protein
MLVKKGTKLNHSNSRAEFVPTDAAIKSARAVFQMKLSTSETKVCSVLFFFSSSTAATKILPSI